LSIYFDLLFYMLLSHLSLEMTYKTGQMSVCPCSVNILKTLARILYRSWYTTSRRRNFAFHPPMPRGRDDRPTTLSGLLIHYIVQYG